ncbi:hypothetical protein E0500_009540 [Streptomyces sp. KM273126]|uniref:hypothetical protein n=1 Tax=Streptomyces sp. KM273126 TaxID=2545247 RepID=UPI00103E5A3E|nr:hypothetical protein [Streptomyces sp. KM273126]MBA2807648.1 hypothetical protein [Streptomyces sp. KM273126]
MRHPYRLPVLVFVAGVFVVAAAWLWQERWVGHPAAAPGSGKTSAAAAPSAPAASTLSAARLRSALIGEGDLGGAWAPTAGAATWRDGLLKGRADRPECQELLDAVYAEDLLGEPSGATAVEGFDDTEYGAQVRYQVGAYRKQDVDAKLGHLGRLAGQCREFTSTGASGEKYDVRVAPVRLPGVGDAREALRMTVGGEVDGERGELTLDVAALRVGDGAALLTHGGLYGIEADITRHAAQLAAERLRDTLAGKPPRSARPSARPSERPAEEGQQERQEEPAYEANPAYEDGETGEVDEGGQ